MVLLYLSVVLFALCERKKNHKEDSMLCFLAQRFPLLSFLNSQFSILNSSPTHSPNRIFIISEEHLAILVSSEINTPQHRCTMRKIGTRCKRHYHSPAPTGRRGRTGRCG